MRAFPANASVVVAMTAWPAPMTRILNEYPPTAARTSVTPNSVSKPPSDCPTSSTFGTAREQRQRHGGCLRHRQLRQRDERSQGARKHVHHGAEDDDVKEEPADAPDAARKSASVCVTGLKGICNAAGKSVEREDGAKSADGRDPLVDAGDVQDDCEDAQAKQGARGGKRRADDRLERDAYELANEAVRPSHQKAERVQARLRLALFCHDHPSSRPRRTRATRIPF